jgi:hypothetical protein
MQHATLEQAGSLLEVMTISPVIAVSLHPPRPRCRHSNNRHVDLLRHGDYYITL